MTAPDSSACSRCGASVGPGVSFCPRCGTGIPVAVGGAGAVATAPGRTRDERDALLDALRQAALGEYEILAELGRGGMATVYLAHDLALDRKVAIKVLAPALLHMGEGMVERFKREARTAAALSHPHIIPIYAVKESEHVLYFVMKYVQGRPLDSIIHGVGPLPIPMVQTILAHVGDALGYAHRHGVVHRDVKSANIMLDEDGWALVTDFGIAKVVQAEGLTMTGVTVGTPTYMSPEQCDTREVTGASDQYSLGVVAYEMLAGRLPFRGDSTMSVMYAHFNQRPRPVTELRPDCPPNLAAGVMRMLEKEPDQRWPSMDDVLAVCGRAHAVQAEFKTPTSPIALSKSEKQAPTAGRGARRLPGLWWGLAVAASAFALWWLTPWRGLLTPMAPRPAAGRDTTPAAEVVRVPVDSASVRPPPAPGAARAPAQRPPARIPALPQAPPARGAAPESVSRNPADEREDSLVRSARDRALAAKSRAHEAGATPAELATGDTALRAAESLAAQGRVSGAMDRLFAAASLWTEAERAARTRAARDTVRPTPAELPVRPPAAQPPADPREEIKAVIADYGRALESRDLSDVRRAYPGLTSAEQETFRQFFQSVRELKAGLTINRLVIAGGSADAIVSGVYEYVDAKTGRTKRDTTAFRATLVQDGAGWHLTSIRSLP